MEKMNDNDAIKELAGQIVAIDYAITAIKERAELREKYELLIQDECDQDTEIRTLAKKIYTEAYVEGDSIGVTPVTVIIDRMVREIMELTERIKT